MQENNFLLCLRNPRENIFSKLQIFVFYIYKKKRSKHVRVLAVCNTQKHFFIFSLSKTQTSHLITIKNNKPHINQILKALIIQLLNPKKIFRNMFLHFHRKYNMILFVPKILDHMQIKTLIFFIFLIL